MCCYIGTGEFKSALLLDTYVPIYCYIWLCMDIFIDDMYSVFIIVHPVLQST